MVGSDGAVVGDGAAANWTQLAKLMNDAVADQKATSHRARHERIDRELAGAGLEPDDPSLWSEQSGGSA
jgi:hypothetical protein